MTRTTLIEIIVVLVVFITTILILNPFNVWMPDMAHLVVLGCLLAAFGAFAALVLREKADDEREDHHRMLSGRAAFLVGATLLVFAIAYQANTGLVDAWLVLTLLAMIFVKLGVRFYSDWKQ